MLGAVVDLDGRITLGESTGLLRDNVRQLLSQGTRKIVLNLANVSYMDSAGLGTLVGAYVSAKRAGCELELINFNQRVKELLGLTHLLSVFESCGRHFTKFP